LKTKIDVNNQKLVFAGREFENNKRIEEYYIDEDAMINLTIEGLPFRPIEQYKAPETPP